MKRSLIQQVRLINDLGIINDYLITRFVTLSEWREIKNNKK